MVITRSDKGYYVNFCTRAPWFKDDKIMRGWGGAPPAPRARRPSANVRGHNNIYPTHNPELFIAPDKQYLCCIFFINLQHIYSVSSPIYGHRPFPGGGGGRVFFLKNYGTIFSSTGCRGRSPPIGRINYYIIHIYIPMYFIH